MSTDAFNRNDLLRLLDDLRPEHLLEVYQFARRLQVNGHASSPGGSETPFAEVPILSAEEKLRATAEWLDGQSDSDCAEPGPCPPPAIA